MKNTLKISTAIAAVMVSSSAFGVAGLDRLVFTPSFLFEKGNYAELTLARADPAVSAASKPLANVADEVDTVKLAAKFHINDKFSLGLMLNDQPIGVDVDYKAFSTNTLRGSVSAKSLIMLGHYKATDRISVYGGINQHKQSGHANLQASGLPGDLVFAQDHDTGHILGAAYSIPKIALRASLTYESDMTFSHATTNSDPVGSSVYNAPLGFAGVGLGGGNTTSATPEAWTLELQSGIAKNPLLFGSVRKSKWSDAQVKLAGVQQLSEFDDTTVYKLGLGRKFSDSISGSVTFNYEEKTGVPSSPFSPQDGEKGVAVGIKYTAKNGLATSLGVQYRKLGDTVIRNSGDPLRPGAFADTPFTDNDVLTVGLKFSKNF